MRRTYYVCVEVMKEGLRESLAKGTTRARYGIFCTNDWRPKATEILRKLGYEPDHNLMGRTDDYPVLAYGYGSYSKDGIGRSGSSIMSIYCRSINGETKTQRICKL